MKTREISARVGAYEAKTHLSALLDRVSRGETITITRHGVPVAMLVPPEGTRRRKDIEKAIEDLKRVRKQQSLGGISFRELIEEGRRY